MPELPECFNVEQLKSDIAALRCATGESHDSPGLVSELQALLDDLDVIPSEGPTLERLIRLVGGVFREIMKQVGVTMETLEATFGVSQPNWVNDTGWSLDGDTPETR